MRDAEATAFNLAAFKRKGVPSLCVLV